MRKLFFLALSLVAVYTAGAQYTFTCTSIDLVNKSSQAVTEHNEVRQIYNISLKDRVLVHNVFEDGVEGVSDSQVYQITEVKESGANEIVFYAKSGVSGKLYEYRLVDAEGAVPALWLKVADEDYDMRYNGMVSTMKTFQQ